MAVALRIRRLKCSQTALGGQYDLLSRHAKEALTTASSVSRSSLEMVAQVRELRREARRSVRWPGQPIGCFSELFCPYNDTDA